MEFIELAKSRYSVRSFSKRRVEDEKLNKILEAAAVAPTAANAQPQKIYVLNSAEAIENINSVCKCIFGASTVILITSDTDTEWKNPFTEDYHTGEIDCSIVCTHIMLQAWELGVGSCWVGYYDPEKIKNKMGLPENEKVVAILPVGYPAENSVPSPMHASRKPLTQTVKYL